MCPRTRSGRDWLVSAVRRQIEGVGQGPHPRPVAGAVVVDRKEHVLLVYSTYAGQGWHLPKGGIDEGEDVVAAAMREASEEAGVAVLAIPSLPLFPLGLTGTYVEPIGFGSPRYDGEGPGISVGALALLRTAAENAGAIEGEFEEHKLTLFDALAQTPVLWQTQATYCVFAWKDGEARRMPETSGPPQWVALGALAQMPGLHAHAKELFNNVHLKEAVAVAATHASPR